MMELSLWLRKKRKLMQGNIERGMEGEWGGGGVGRWEGETVFCDGLILG
jgi:hypothetical protein